MYIRKNSLHIYIISVDKPRAFIESSDIPTVLHSTSTGHIIGPIV